MSLMFSVCVTHIPASWVREQAKTCVQPGSRDGVLITPDTPSEELHPTGVGKSMFTVGSTQNSLFLRYYVLLVRITTVKLLVPTPVCRVSTAAPVCQARALQPHGADWIQESAMRNWHLHQALPSFCRVPRGYAGQDSGPRQHQAVEQHHMTSWLLFWFTSDGICVTK